MKHPWLGLLYLLYCVEAGVFLVLVPWSAIWLHSWYAQVPALRPLLLSGFVRGAVSALGLLHLAVAARDGLAYCRALRST